jgi:Peptidyl-prolyl cis-trans isomerase (rotamase) - cyclophilin family
MANSYKVQFETTRGTFVVDVNASWAPLGAERFRSLVEAGFYNGAKFFRVVPGFVVQFGLPADPQAARGIPAQAIPDDPVASSNVKGAITFATAGPNTRTTQVFINLTDNERLDSMGFAPFGAVVEGMDVVEQLYSGYGDGAPYGRGPDQGRIRSQAMPISMPRSRNSTAS